MAFWETNIHRLAFSRTEKIQIATFEKPNYTTIILKWSILQNWTTLTLVLDIILLFFKSYANECVWKQVIKVC